jgi:hypothetical protein
VLRAGTIVQTSTEQGSYVDLALGDANAPVMSASPVAFKPFIPNSRLAYQPTAEQNVVRLWENTALGIDRLSAMQTGADTVTDTQLDLKAGHITGNVKKMSASSKYEVKLPNGVAGIRGTVYDLTSDGMVKVLVGSVVMAWVNPKSGEVVTKVVMGGQQYNSSLEQTVTVTAVSGPSEGQVLYVPDKTLTMVSPVVTAPVGSTPVVPPGAAGQ